MSFIERCRSCGFEHEGTDFIFYKRNHVSNKVLPFCAKCSRRLYNVTYHPAREL